MKIANLVLEYLKVLIWPIVTLILFFRFKSSIERILSQLGSRVETADTVKFDAFGQTLEISGTAKALTKQKNELLEKPDRTGLSKKKARSLEKSIQHLENPMTDFVGVALLKFKDGVNIIDLSKEVMNTFSVNTKSFSPPQILIFHSGMRDILSELQQLNLLVMKDDFYILSVEGIKFFTEIKNEQEQLITKFKSSH